MLFAMNLLKTNKWQKEKKYSFQHLSNSVSPFCTYACVCKFFIILLYICTYVHCMFAIFAVSLTYPKAVPTAAGASIYDSERHLFNKNT